jgi:ABC-type nitrate/sulfonate/bicarbonate transport system substrate-binding protein
MRRAFPQRIAMAGCVLLLAIAAVPAQAEKLRVGTPAGKNFTFLPARIGAQSGIFSKYGLEVEVTDFSGGAKLQQAAVAGGIDVAVSAGTDIGFIAKGAPELAVAAMGDRPPLGIVVAYDSTAKTTDDLKGKKIGVTTAGSLTEWMMRRLIRQKGWSPDAVTLVPVGSDIAAQTALMATGQIEGVVSPPSLGYQLEISKRGRVLLPTFDIGADFVGEAIYATQMILRDNPDAVRRFLKGWFETIAWMRANKAATVEIARSYTQYSPEIESKEYDLVMPIFSRDGKFHPAALRTLQESFVEMGSFEKPPDLSKLYTEEYLPARSK